MATATKSSRIKNVKTKKVLAKPIEAHEDGVAEIDPIPLKNKKPLEIDEPEVAVAGVEEKIEEDPLVAAVEDEESEEAVLDGEELNPFGDRWEE